MSAALRLSSDPSSYNIRHIVIAIDNNATYRLLGVIGELDALGVKIERIIMPNSILGYAPMESLQEISNLEDVASVRELYD